MTVGYNSSAYLFSFRFEMIRSGVCCWGRSVCLRLSVTLPVFARMLSRPWLDSLTRIPSTLGPARRLAPAMRNRPDLSDMQNGLQLADVIERSVRICQQETSDHEE